MIDKPEKNRVERHSTKYVGVFFRIADRIGGIGTERVYYVSYKKNNKKIETKVGRQYADDMTPARANQIRNDLIEGRRITNAQQRRIDKEKLMTISDIWDRYQKDRANNKGIKQDVNRFNVHLKDMFGNCLFRDITKDDIKKFKENLSDKTPKTVKNILELLVRLSNFSRDECDQDGLSFRVRFPKVDNETTEDLTDEQLRSLLDVLDKESKLDIKHIMLLALYTGMRRSEIFKLKWTDINFDRGLIEIRNPKSGKDKTIPMNDLTRVVLEQCTRHKSDYLFPGRGGGHRKDMHKDADRIRNAAGLPKGFRPMHGLRHFFATSLICSGKVDLADLQKLMTHSSIQMTLRYAKKRDERLAAASNVVTEIFKK